MSMAVYIAAIISWKCFWNTGEVLSDFDRDTMSNRGGGSGVGVLDA